MDLPTFLGELRRRRVGRVLVAYGVFAFAVLQVVEPVLHALHLEDWVLSVVVLALALGFPVAVALAWAFDLQAGGVERTAPLPGQGGAGMALPVILLGLGAAVPGVAWLLLRGGAALPGWVAPAALVALGAVVALAVRLVRGRPGADPDAPAAAPPTVAVLPFDDLSPERDQAWFCDGVAEELLGALCGLSGLRVVARSSSFQFKGRAVDAREVGRLLGATALLEGSVRRAGTQVRVAARLVDTRRGLELWSERFDRDLADTFAVQEEIAQAVVRAMRLQLTSQEQVRLRKVGASRGTRDPRAYEHYLRGRHALMLMGDRRTLEARDAFRQALALDPAFAQAQAGLADADVVLLTWNLDVGRADELRAEALAASEAALRLEPELAEARLAHANVLTLLDRWAEAEADFRRAMELNPGWGDACYFYARALFTAGRHDDAAGAFEEAVRRNPDDFSSLALLEGVHRRRGDLPAARRAGRRGLEAVARRLALDPDDVRALYLGAGLDLRFGDRDRASLRIERAVALLPDDFATLYNAACFYSLAGERERALATLDRAVAGGRGLRRWMEQDADFDAIRADPRFGAILARVVG